MLFVLGIWCCDPVQSTRPLNVRFILFRYHQISILFVIAKHPTIFIMNLSMANIRTKNRKEGEKWRNTTKSIQIMKWMLLGKYRMAEKTWWMNSYNHEIKQFFYFLFFSQSDFVTFLAMGFFGKMTSHVLCVYSNWRILNVAWYAYALLHRREGSSRIEIFSVQFKVEKTCVPDMPLTCVMA